jgi:hypothetical protein
MPLIHPTIRNHPKLFTKTTLNALNTVTALRVEKAQDAGFALGMLSPNPLTRRFTIPGGNLSEADLLPRIGVENISG